MLQHGAYTLLTDACYDREQFPTLAEALEWAWAGTEAEAEAVKFVLSRFFALENGVYVQKRIKEELDEYREKAATNARIATERETKRRLNSTNRTQVVYVSTPDLHEASPNHKPITNNQEPLTINQEQKTNQQPEKITATRKSATPSKPDGVDAQVWADWLALRKQKRAAVTETVMRGAEAEAAKAGMLLNDFFAVWCRRGSQGLEAEWLKPHERGKFDQKSFAERSSDHAAAEIAKWAPSIAAKREIFTIEEGASNAFRISGG